MKSQKSHELWSKWMCNGGSMLAELSFGKRKKKANTQNVILSKKKHLNKQLKTQRSCQVRERETNRCEGDKEKERRDRRYGGVL